MSFKKYMKDNSILLEIITIKNIKEVLIEMLPPIIWGIFVYVYMTSIIKATTQDIRPLGAMPVVVILSSFLITLIICWIWWSYLRYRRSVK